MVAQGGQQKQRVLVVAAARPTESTEATGIRSGKSRKQARKAGESRLKKDRRI